MVFKFGTAVVSLITAGFISAACAAEGSSTTFGGTDIGVACKTPSDNYYKYTDSGEATKAAEWKKLMDECVNSYKGNTSVASDCPSVTAEFNKKKGEFAGACDTAQIPINTDRNHIACSKAMTVCSCYPPSTVDTTSTKGQVCNSEFIQNDIKSALQGAKVTQTPRDGVDINQLNTALAYCPTVEQSDLETLEKQIAESKRSIPQLKNDASKAKGEAEQAGIDAEKEAGRLQDEADTAAETYAKDMQALVEKGQEANKQIREEVQAIESEIMSMEQKHAELESQKTDVDIAMNAKIQETDMICYAQGVTSVDKRQQAIAAAGPRKRGNSSDMMKQVGLTDRAYWQREAIKEYDRCKLTDIYTKPVAQARIDAQNAIDKLRDAQSFIRSAIAQKKAQITQKISTGCEAQPVERTENGGMTGTDACQNLKNEIAQQEILRSTYDTKMKSNKAKQDLARKEGKAKQRRLYDDAAQKSAMASEEERRLENLRDQLGALKKSSHGGQLVADKESYRNARKTFGELKAAADQVQNACSTDSGVCQPMTACQSARDFLAAVGVDPTNIHSGSTEESGGSHTSSPDYSDDAGATTEDAGG